MQVMDVFKELSIFMIIILVLTESSNCSISDPVICITGSTTYNNWFYTQYVYSGCYGDKPYYYNTTNEHYIYWNYQYNRWQSYTVLGSNSDSAYDTRSSVSLFSSNGDWSVYSATIYRNTDICLEIHPSTCSQATISNACNCNNTITSICITGTTSYNSWFYTQYNYAGCYGDKPYYYNTTNNHHIYFNQQYNRWQSYTVLGSNSDTAYDTTSSVSLFSINAKWSVYSS
eukprot:406174_1